MLEVQGIVVRFDRFQAEYLDKCASLFPEVQPYLYYFGVVEYDKVTFRQVAGQGGENVFANIAVAVDEQLRLVAHWQWELGDALVGQRVVVVADVYMFGVLCHKVMFYREQRYGYFGRNHYFCATNSSLLNRERYENRR